ncbi:MAG: hypothetical protein KGJ99_07785 [Betaproteobacteria bacterium]|nr:hypothetical protein [Betaproteobacteria bacterium]
MNESRSLRSLALWVVLFALVLAILGWETDWGDGVSLPVPGAGAVAPQPVDVALMPEYAIEGGLAARKETVDRVLFNPTRRPAPPATQTAGGNSAFAHGKYVLTGTTVAGDVATAMLREVAGGKSHTVRKGDKIDGALVADVTPDSVKLTQGGDSEELHLKVALGPATTAQGPMAGTLPPGVAGAPMGAEAAREAAAAARARSQSAFGPLVGGQAAVGQPAAGARPGIVSVGELLAERRAAAQAAAAGNAPVPNNNSSRGFGR